LLGTTLGIRVLVDEVADEVGMLEDAGADEDTPNALPAEGEPLADEWRDPKTLPTTPPTSASNSTVTKARDNQNVVTRSLQIRLSGIRLQSPVMIWPCN
jgi:hypothetical protein